MTVSTAPANPFRLVSGYQPVGDQPAAIDAIADAFEHGARHATLVGATGTGKTFTMANVIARLGKPTLIISHNKTLAAQLYEEMKELFPHNAVAYFVSYYDYYQPEAYIPQRDIYIEKDASRNDDLDRLRLAATSHLVSRDDVIVVASVSCIFGLGSPLEFKKRVLLLEAGTRINRRDLLIGLTDMQYARNEMDLKRGAFRVRGDVIEIHPANEEIAVRVELFGDSIERLQVLNPVTMEVVTDAPRLFIFPAVQYMLPEEQLQSALDGINAELEEQVQRLKGQGRLLEAHRLMARTKYDVEMIQEVGFCSGIENYARHLDGRPPGSRPFTLLDYFNHVPGRPADDWIVMIDESHVTVPQISGMFFGDRSRKQTLVDHGFRLPSAMDNRPLRFEEFEELVPRVLYVSATPGPYELERTGGTIVEQIIRPTGLVDPEIVILPASGQVSDLIERCRERADRNQRILVTALTKRLCEDLTRYLGEKGLKVRYLHSEIDTLERLEILRALREGEFDVLVGVNLLREGLDLPEVSMVAILDADKEGFLRSTTSLIQTIGRCARNIDARVIMYADKVTPSMQAAIDETARRRATQLAYNEEHGITPTQITKAIRRGIEMEVKASRTVRDAVGAAEETFDRDELASIIEAEMLDAAESLDFERAAQLRDQVALLRQQPADEKVRRSQVEKKTSARSRRRK